MKFTVPLHNNQPVDDQQRLRLVDSARNYLGVPWRHLGRDRSGLDCAGLLIIVIFEVLGALVEVKDYSTWPSPMTLREICGKILLKGNRMEPHYGDVVLMSAGGYGVVHMGWYAGSTVIHASNEPGIKRVIETASPIQGFYGVFQVPKYEV